MRQVSLKEIEAAFIATKTAPPPFVLDCPPGRPRKRMTEEEEKKEKETIRALKKIAESYKVDMYKVLGERRCESCSAQFSRDCTSRIYSYNLCPGCLVAGSDSSNTHKDRLLCLHVGGYLSQVYVLRQIKRALPSETCKECPSYAKCLTVEVV
jgi:predicted Zn-ribbon and HTH transcriptional regulator